MVQGAVGLGPRGLVLGCGAAAQLRVLGLGSVCDVLSVQGREMGWECCRYP